MKSKYIFFVSACIIFALRATAVFPQDAPIFVPDSGLAEYYTKFKSAEPMIDTRECPPGVSGLAADGTVTPCGDVPTPLPINPCSASSSCGPGVGIEGGLVRPVPDQWNAKEILGEK